MAAALDMMQDIMGRELGHEIDQIAADYGVEQTSYNAALNGVINNLWEEFWQINLRIGRDLALVIGEVIGQAARAGLPLPDIEKIRRDLERQRLTGDNALTHDATRPPMFGQQ